MNRSRLDFAKNERTPAREVTVRSRCAMLIAGAVLTSFAYPLRAADDDLARAIDGWRERQLSVHRAKFVLEGEVMLCRGYHNTSEVWRPDLGDVPSVDHVSPISLIIVLDFDHNLARMETSGDEFMIHDGAVYCHRFAKVEMYDGTTIRVAYPRKQNTGMFNLRPLWPEVVIEGDIYQHFFVQADEWPVFFAAGVLMKESQPLRPKQLRMAPDAAMFRLVGRAEVGGRPCALLRTADIGDARDRFYEVWVDLEHQGAVLRWVSSRNGQHDLAVDVEYGDHPDGWLPLAWTVHDYGKDETVLKWEKLRVVVAEINPELRPELFSCAVERGMIVQNNLTNEHYTAGAPGERNIPVTEAVAGATRIGWVPLTPIVAIAVVLLFVAYRNRGRRRNPRS